MILISVSPRVKHCFYLLSMLILATCSIFLRKTFKPPNLKNLFDSLILIEHINLQSIVETRWTIQMLYYSSKDWIILVHFLKLISGFQEQLFFNP